MEKKKETKKKNQKVTKKDIKKEVKKEGAQPVKKEQVAAKELKLVDSRKMIAGVVMGVILIALVLASIFGLIGPKDYSKSYLVEEKVAKELNCNEIEEVTKKNQSFILFTNFNSEEEYNLEKELKDIITEYNLENDFYVLAQTDTCGSIDEPTSDLRMALKVAEDIKTMPTIFYYEDGELIDFIKRADENPMQAADFMQLLDMFEITRE